MPPATALMTKPPLLATFVEPDTKRIWPTLPATMPAVPVRRSMLAPPFATAAPLLATQVGALHTWLS